MSILLTDALALSLSAEHRLSQLELPAHRWIGANRGYHPSLVLQLSGIAVLRRLAQGWPAEARQEAELNIADPALKCSTDLLILWMRPIDYATERPQPLDSLP